MAAPTLPPARSKNQFEIVCVRYDPELRKGTTPNYGRLCFPDGACFPICGEAHVCGDWSDLCMNQRPQTMRPFVGRLAIHDVRHISQYDQGVVELAVGGRIQAGDNLRWMAGRQFWGKRKFPVPKAGMMGAQVPDINGMPEHGAECFFRQADTFCNGGSVADGKVGAKTAEKPEGCYFRNRPNRGTVHVVLDSMMVNEGFLAAPDFIVQRGKVFGVQVLVVEVCRIFYACDP